MDVAVIIPAYKPDMRLKRHVEALLASGFCKVVVVDDGSPAEFRPVFDSLAEIGRCTVLRHEANRGKGAALKTGFAWVAESVPDVVGVVMCDADGQHRPECCVAVAEAMLAGARGLYLGCRDFSSAGVPLRSRFGNFWISVFFWLLHGMWLGDTQTGLRAFRREDLEFMASVPGDRFAYEMEMLCAASRSRLRMAKVHIETVYEPGNPTSHFSPISDSFVICKVVFADFLRYAGVSISSFLLDQGLAWALHAALSAAGLSHGGAIWASGFAARFASSVYNYFMNRAFVFRDRRSVMSSAWRYVLLCVAVICASNAAVTLLVKLGSPRVAAKLCADIALYLVCYAVQRRWVFSGEGKGA